MASLLVQFSFLVFLLPIGVIAQNSTDLSMNSTVISMDSLLSPNNRTSWLSPSGIFAFGFYEQGDGFAVGIWLINPPQNTIVWTANRDDPPFSFNSTLQLTSQGLLIGDVGGEGKQIGDVGDSTVVSAAVLDSGNFVLYDINSTAIWESFDFPTDTILGGQDLTGGSKLVSCESTSNHSSGRFSLNMQTDGNLVAYPFNSPGETDDAYWSSGTFSPDFRSLSLNQTGKLYMGGYGFKEKLFANGSHSSPASMNISIIYRATLDVDGNFRLYMHYILESTINLNVSIEWAALPDQCDVKGFCGLNSYCSNMGAKADCFCFPGFDQVDPSNKFLGCYRNFSDDDCGGGNDPAMLTNIFPLNNMWWGDDPYFRDAMEEEDCGKSCEGDCNCEAALYTDNSCNKFKLPLRYAKKPLVNKSTTAFVKVISMNNKTDSDILPPIVLIKSRRTLVLILGISLGSTALLCFIIAIFGLSMYWRRVHRYRKLSENSKLGIDGEEIIMRSFTYEELEKVTGGFGDLLGRGSFGTVYKGKAGNKTVAVKRLENMIEEGERVFRSEMTAIGRTNHKNLVRLLGFCIEGSKMLLVYEYMSNGSLADVFKAKTRLSWKERMKIALDVARGILYLHEECEVCIVHYNIKPQNILLDDTLTAKIADFGLAKLLMPNQPRIILGGERKSGYLAPEWRLNTSTSAKADIYSFGIILLEIACCRSNIEGNVPTADEIALPNWAYNCFVAGKLDELVDDENVELNLLERMVKVALWCIQDDQALRPPVKSIILMLEGTMDIPIPPPTASFVISS